MSKKLLLVFLLSVYCVAQAQGIEGSPVSTPDSRAEASRQSAEMFRQIQKENQRQKEMAKQRIASDAKVDRMIGRNAEIKAKTNYPIVVYDPKTATKTKKQSSLISKIKIPASIPHTAKRFGKGLGSNLLALAIYEILGRSVDYVLDEKNNRVIINDSMYKNSEVDKYLGSYNVYDTDSAKSISEKFFNKLKYDVIVTHCQDKESGIDCFWGYKGEIPDRVLPFDKFDSSISLDEIAEKTHEMADKGNASAQKFLEDIANDRLSKGEFDEKIKSNAKDESDTTNSTKQDDDVKSPIPDDLAKPVNNELLDPVHSENNPQPLELPKFCDWAKPVCDYMDWTKEQYKDLKEEPEQKPDRVTVEEHDIDFQSIAERPYITFGGSCPAPYEVPIAFMGAKTTLHLSYQPFCNFAVMIKPALIMGAWISALLIISGGRAKGE